MRPFLRNCIVISSLLLSGALQAEEIVSFDHAPSVEELKKALGVDKPKTRSIVMDNASEETSRTTPSAKAIAVQLKFQSGSARIAKESVPYLETVADLLNQAPNLSLVIEGHTDASGSPEKNQKLSAERAQAVKVYLAEKLGIDVQRIQAVGKGSSEPLAGKDPRFPGNRRVQFRFAN